MTTSKWLDGFSSTIAGSSRNGHLSYRTTIHRPMDFCSMHVKSLQLIWQAILKIWQLCNPHLHPASHKQEDHSLLEAAVHQIFNEAHQHPILHPMIKNLTPEHILISCPTCHAQQ